MDGNLLRFALGNFWQDDGEQAVFERCFCLCGIDVNGERNTPLNVVILAFRKINGVIFFVRNIAFRAQRQRILMNR